MCVDEADLSLAIKPKANLRRQKDFVCVDEADLSLAIMQIYDGDEF